MSDQSSQYSFLSRQWPELFQEALRVEEFALTDARTACFYARRTIELLVEWAYENDSQLQRPFGYGTLADLIFAADFRQLAADQMPRFRLLKDLGNKAVHRTDPIRPGDAVLAAGELFQVLRWFVLSYGQDPSSLRGCRFDPALLPSKNAALEQQAQSQAQLETLATQLAERDQQLRDQRLATLASTEELDRLRKEITALRKANQDAAQPEPDLSEFETRQGYINLYLEEAGWVHGKSCTHEHEVDGMPNATGQGFVDYVLWGDDGKALALVEAKKTSRDPMEGQRQAELYADALERRYGQRPLIFLSNGYRHRIWDDLRYPPRDVQGFYKKAELETLIRRRDTLLPLAQATISKHIADRYYQDHAIRAIAESLEKGRRKVLLVQATGTGKTRTAIALTELLIRCNWIKRVLFLADRTALVIQAERAFRRFLPDASPVNLVTNRGGEGRVFLSTYPTMMNLIDAENSDRSRRFGVGHFDLVIIDEAHRSVYQKYGAIFGYFDSLLAGLTATPRDEIDRNTYELFDLDVGLPTDEYGRKQAVDDGYLVDFRAISLSLKFPREGIRYDDLSEEEKVQWDLMDWDENEGHQKVDSGAINSWLFNADTVDKALQVLMTQGCRDSNGDGIGKSIIFARNHRHAVFIQERFDHHFPHLAGKTARVIHNKIAYAQSLIEEFSNPSSGLQIAISVDMLDTGIDIPEIVNLMIFKPVRSRTKFWQMVGRGTRLCPDLFGPGRNKENFWIFDCCQNLEFFLDGGGNAATSMPETLTAKLFKTRLSLIDTLDLQSSQDPHRSSPELASHRHTLAEILRGHVAACPADNFQVRPHLELVERFRRPESWQNLTPEDHVLLATTLAPLPSGQASQEGDTDATARRFDLLLYQMQLAWLKGDARFARLQEGLSSLASQLEQQHNNPIVAREMDLIQCLLQEEWWQDLTLPMLEEVRLRLRGLICMIEAKGREPVYTNFTDELGELKELDTSALITRDTFRQFRLRARAFLLEHESHLTMQRLRRNQPLTPSDLLELERFLISHGICDQDLINRASEEAHGFGLFIRSLVGLDRGTAKALFAEFLAEGTHTATQIRFINDIIDELTSRGLMDPARLYDPPFSDLAPSGPEDLFSEDEIDDICSLLKTIRKRAMPQAA
jgi:type I restriction enzyme R subunit